MFYLMKQDRTPRNKVTLQLQTGTPATEWLFSSVCLSAPSGVRPPTATFEPLQERENLVAILAKKYHPQILH